MPKPQTNIRPPALTWDPFGPPSMMPRACVRPGYDGHLHIERCGDARRKVFCDECDWWAFYDRNSAAVEPREPAPNKPRRFNQGRPRTQPAECRCGCGRPSKSHGLSDACLYRWRKAGEPDVAEWIKGGGAKVGARRRRGETPPPCRCGCGRPSWSNGLSNVCNKRWTNVGRPDVDEWIAAGAKGLRATRAERPPVESPTPPRTSTSPAPESPPSTDVDRVERLVNNAIEGLRRIAIAVVREACK